MTITLGAPQIIYLVLSLAGLVYRLSKPTDNYAIEAASAVVAELIVFALLWWGGFF